MTSHIIEGRLPLILCGVNFSGRSFIAKKILSQYPDKIVIAKKFTSIKTLVDYDNQSYFYLDRKIIEKEIENKSYLTMKSFSINNTNDVNNTKHTSDNTYLKDYIGYFREPIEKMIINQLIPILTISYSEIDLIFKRGIINANLVNVIPDEPELLAEKIFNHRFSDVIVRSEEEENKLYEELAKEIEFNRGIILNNYQNPIFNAEINNKYLDTKDFDDTISEVIKKLYKSIDDSATTEMAPDKI